MEKLTVSLVRHGKTAGNMQGSFVGSIDQPVSPEGLEELRRMAAELDYPAVRAVFSSPLMRCLQTAGILYPQHQPTTVEGLRERHFGEFEGLTHSEIIQRPGYEDWGRTEDSMQFPGGEEDAPFFERCTAAFWETVERCAAESPEPVALVCHGGVIMALMTMHCTEERTYFDWMCGNGCGYLLECDPAARKFRVVRRLGV